MIRKVSLILPLLLLVGVVIPLDNPFFGKVLQPAAAFAQGVPGLRDFALYSHQELKFELDESAAVMLDAGGYQTALIGAQVALDGRGSSDPDGDALTYRWSFVSSPDGSTPVLSDPTDSMPTFTADRVGVYDVEVSVDDGTWASLKDTASVTVVSEVLDVTDFVLYADDKIKLDQIASDTDHLGANRHIHIEKGPTGSIADDLRVLDHIKSDGEITIDGEVRIHYAGKEEVDIEDGGVLRGALVAPRANVEFEKDNRLEGSVYARTIYLDPWVRFHYHENRLPIADSQTVSTVEDAPASIALGGSDPADDALTYSVVSQPLHETLTGSAPDLTYTPEATFNGTDEYSFAVTDGIVDSAPDTVTSTANQRMVSVPNLAGLIRTDAMSALAGENLTAGAITDARSDTIAADQEIRHSPAAGASIPEASAVDLVVSPGQESQLPTVSISASPAVINQGESATLSWTAAHAAGVHIDHGIGSVNLNDAEVVSPEHTTVYTITAIGPDGIASANVTIEVRGDPEPQPEASFGKRYEDLVPADATIDSYDPRRFSLITGLIQYREASPLADVAISVHNHPEYGTVASDAEGRFSIPVEGGSTITVVYQKQGLITAHRKVYVPWNDIAIAETIQMIDEDPVSTTLTFDGNPATVVTHESSPVRDEFGSRSATLVFTGDNRAYLMDENGHDVRELATIAIRATEFSTSESVPAKLHPKSAYTYCAELSVDGAQRVRFDKPVMSWIDNFLGFDVGMAVPVGYYDRDQGLWVPAENGTVVRLLDTDADGITDALDADGDDQPDDLNGNGFFSDEVLGLADAQRYAPGSTFWRVAVSHFTPWDWNWPRGFPGGSIGPNFDGVATLDCQHKCDRQKKFASYIEVRSRIFHEDISIPGTGITLHYAGDRVNGYRQVITVPASGDTVPLSLKRIIARVEIAGRSFEQILDPLPDQMAEFVWDGRDHLGRPVQSPLTAHVSVGFAYDAVYLKPGEFTRSFARAGSDINRIIAREEIFSWKRSQVNVAPKTGDKNALAKGWTISNHHRITPSQPWLLFKGDGTTSTRDLPHITTVAGSGLMGYSGDDGHAIAGRIQIPYDVAVDAAGAFYISDFNNQRVRKVAPPSTFKAELGPGEIPFAEDSGLGHIFSNTGMHQRTFDLETGLTLRSFSYDEEDRLRAINDQFGNTISIERDAAGVPLAVISPGGIRTELTLDNDNHLTRITYPDGSYYSFEYTPDGLMTAEIEPAGNRFEHDFSQTGRLTDACDERDGHWNYQRRASADGDILTRQTTGEGNVTSFLDRTDSTGAYTSTITDPSGSQTLFTRSADGLTVSKSADCGMELEFKYGVDSEYKFQILKQITETSPSGLAMVVERDKTYQDTDADDIPDIVAATIALNGKATTFAHYIPAAEKVATSPEGRTVTMLYDSDTLLTESVLIPGLYDTNYEYDAKGRLTRVSTNTRHTAYAYNPEGWLASVTDAEKRTTGYSYDALGRITEISRPDGSYIDFEYDANGNMTLLTNPTGIAHGFGFNNVNRNSSYKTPLSGSYRYVYDKDRRLIQANFPSGKSIINDYANPANPADKSRLWQIVTPEGNIDFTYLCGSKVDSINKGSESIAYTYDGELVTSETLSGTLNQSIDYTYNNSFDVTGFTFADDTASYIYDNDGLLIGAGKFTIWRNADNGLAESVTGNALDLVRTFNGYGEVDAQTGTVGSRDVAGWSLTRDNNGRIISKTETVDSVTSRYKYTYDEVGRLLTVVKDGSLVEEYRYGFNGTRNYEMKAFRRIATRSYSYSDEGHLLTAGTTSYVYDLDGFLTTKTDGNEVSSFTYSSGGELLNVSLPDGRLIEYVHDPLGRRIAKIVDGVIIEKYLWQGLTRLLAVYDGADNLMMRFEYADDRMPVAVNAEGVGYYLAYDQVGSLRLVVDSAGNVIKSVEYDSFGNILSDSNPIFAVPFGFVGGLHDRDTGLIRFGYRDYDPDIGRWTAKDPVGFAGGDTDLYGFVENNPITANNPWGLLIQVVGTPEQKESTLKQMKKLIRGDLTIDDTGMLSRSNCECEESTESDIDELIDSDKVFKIHPYLSKDGWGRSSTVLTEYGAELFLIHMLKQIISPNY